MLCCFRELLKCFVLFLWTWYVFVLFCWFFICHVPMGSWYMSYSFYGFLRRVLFLLFLRCVMFCLCRFLIYIVFLWVLDMRHAFIIWILEMYRVLFRSLNSSRMHSYFKHFIWRPIGPIQPTSAIIGSWYVFLWDLETRCVLFIQILRCVVFYRFVTCVYSISIRSWYASMGAAALHQKNCC